MSLGRRGRPRDRPACAVVKVSKFSTLKHDSTS